LSYYRFSLPGENKSAGVKKTIQKRAHAKDWEIAAKKKNRGILPRQGLYMQKTGLTLVMMIILKMILVKW
jgi:tRNA/tmRNA/rRNA uracil-C5-methylase (TrmA/RlmC/RlmD family)